ncbi:uncharacterized protein METZ01_LOCUS101699, partial [marine metagenome]
MSTFPERQRLQCRNRFRCKSEVDKPQCPAGSSCETVGV